MAKLDVPAGTITVERNAPIEVRDGTVLRADIFRTAAGGSHPVLLVRNPYGAAAVRTVPVLPAVDAGFAVVLQDCRGTGVSDGEFVTFENEAADGADTIGWCARQPWCNGTVVMYGPSYLGMVQLAAASQSPEALRGMVMAVTPADYHWGLAYRQGAFQLGQLLPWHAAKAAQQLAYNAAAGADVSAAARELSGLLADPATGYARLPLRDMPVLSELLPSWQRWLDRPDRDAYWAGLSYAAARDRVAAPALHIGGWFDLFLGGTLDNFTYLSGHAATEAARRGQRLIIGPWSHGDRSGVLGELHFGAAASDAAAGLEPAVLGFLRDAAGLGDGQPDQAGPRVRLFVMGDNVWRDEDDWPLPRTQWTRWYLHEGGTLSAAEPGPAEAPSRYFHDPRDPVPTAGGALVLASGPGRLGWLPGPRDQRAVEARPDVLCFTSEALPADLEVTGPVSVTLHAATSAADADFTAKLVDVYPDGRALGVTDGIVRARYRDGSGTARPVIPGEVAEYTIDLIATGWVFRAGHRLRVDVASANFPCFDRNPGNGGPVAAATEADFVTANQTIRHDAAHPSCITLPVIPR